MSNRAYKIQALFLLAAVDEAAIVLDGLTQKRVRNTVAWFFKILKDWFVELDESGKGVSDVVDTASFIFDLNIFLRDKGELNILFSKVEDTSFDLVGAADYDFATDIITVEIIRNYRYPGPRPRNSLFMEYYQTLTTQLEHEFIHREQYRRRSAHTRNPMPYFGMDAYADVQRDKKQLKENPRFQSNPRWTLRPALTLTRRRTISPEPASFPRDVLHTRKDSNRIPGKEDPRHRTGLHDYYGHPEEIMAFAWSFALCVLEARRQYSIHKYAEQWGKIAADKAVYYFHEVRRHTGVHTAAFRLWVKHVYAYLEQYLSPEDIERSLGTIVFGNPNHRGGLRSLL